MEIWLNWVMADIFGQFLKMTKVVSSPTVDKKSLIMGTRIWDLMFFYLVYLLAVFRAIVLATTMATQYFMFSIFQQTFSVALEPLQRHYYPRESFALSTQSYWWG